MAKSQAFNKLMIVVGILFFLLVALQAPAATLNHKMDVELLPTLKVIKVEDTITFPTDFPRKISFLLHKDLQVAVTSAGDSVKLLHPAAQNEIYSEYGLSIGSVDSKVHFSYSGVVYDPVVQDNSNGMVSADGAVLFGNTYWYPSFSDGEKSFDVTVKTPANWTALVQGQLTNSSTQGSSTVSRYVEIYPQEDIYLVAGPFNVWQKETSTGKKLQVLLRQDEPELAQNYLALMPDYIQHYSDIIAPYPYEGFSVVENIWETGLGMPSFTLLGSTVLRLPFILTSSLPHEILHNWWGNSVYVDYEAGNWSEGLTTYMADYWQQQVAGTDKNYRLNTMINFADFVSANPQNDFPVRKFKGRHNSSSQAIGYGKSMMFFHMLDFRFGTDDFNKALQDFYANNVYKKASFADLQISFEKITHQNLDGFFAQWLDQTGAPEIELTDVKLMRWYDNDSSTTYVLSQKQDGAAYDLAVPVIWTLESGEEVRQIARLSQKAQIFSFVSKSRPVKISVDPDYHVFRSLYQEERPATLSSVLGSRQLHFFIEKGNAGALQFAKTWSKATEGKSIFHQMTTSFGIPGEGALIFVGDNNAFSEFMKNQLAEQDFHLNDKSVEIQGQEFSLQDTSTVVVARLKNNPAQSIVWVRWSADMKPDEWAARLTHYGSFGVLVFQGKPVVLKSTWPVTASPLQRNL